LAIPFGGFTVRIFNRLYPDDVLGVVLVDAPSSEDEDDRFNVILPDAVKEQEKKNDEWNERLDRILTPFKIYLGIERLQVATGWGDPEYNRTLPPEMRRELLVLRQQKKFRVTQASIIAAFPESVRQVRASGNLGDRPLIVLTAGIPYDPDPLLTKELMEKVRNLWINELQAQEARLSARGKQIVVPDSSHMIPYERPDAVVKAIHEVWSAVQ
jgi:pimeloyl-ACP methyl ester carboxylesterase